MIKFLRVRGSVFALSCLIRGSGRCEKRLLFAFAVAAECCGGVGGNEHRSAICKPI